jgi:obg-like ATPase 1
VVDRIYSGIGKRSSEHVLKLPSSPGGLAVTRRLSARLLLGQGTFQRFHLTLLRSKKSMPPKKKSEGAEGPGPLLGRFGTSLKCGIVGLPNVG